MSVLLLVPISLQACSGTDYLADITKDTHSGCFTTSTNYLGFTETTTYLRLGDNAAAVNAAPGCAGVTAGSPGSLPAVPTVIPIQPAPVGKTQ